MGNKKKTLTISIISIVAFMFAILMISSANAALWACFNKGDKINFCNPKVKDRTCTSSPGCQYCMSNFNATGNCFNQGNPNVCNYLPQKCSPIGGGNSTNTTIDTKPPVLTVTSPVSGNIYPSKSVLFSLSTDEAAVIYYMDNTNPKATWIKISSSLTTSLSKNVNLKDGLNNLTIKAVDANGNPTTAVFNFYIDSQVPKISKTAPAAKAFANGIFEVWFTTGYAKSLVLNYGNSAGGMLNAPVDLSKCTIASGKYDCVINNVDLSKYNNQAISYSFKLTNSADVSVQSKPVALNVDISSPVVNNQDSMFTKTGKYVNFNISITEANLLDVSYYDHVPKAKWVKLCTSLKNGICQKKVTFSPGNHSVDIRVSDKAGNPPFIKNVNFTI